MWMAPNAQALSQAPHLIHFELSITCGCFTLPEIEALTSRIEDALDEDFLDGELGEIEETFNVTLEFPVEMKDEILGYIKEHGKEELVELMIEAARREE